MKYVIVLFLLISKLSTGQTLYEYYLVKGSTDIRNHKYESAKFYLDKAVSRYPDSSQCYYHRGGALYFLHQLDSALSDFNVTLEMDLSNYEVYKWRGMIYHQLNDLVEAEKDYRNFLDFSPKDVHVRLKLVEIQIEKGDLTSAESTLKKLLEENPKNPAVQITVGQLNEKRKNYKRSIEAYTMAITLDPTNGLPFYRRAYSYWQLDRLNEACPDWKKASELGIIDAAYLFESAMCGGPGEPVSPVPPVEEIIEEGN